MVVKIYLISLLFLYVFMNPLSAGDGGDSDSVLTQYYKRDTGRPSVKLINKINYYDVTRYDFEFKSLIWPDDGDIWRHRLSIYVPRQIHSRNALMLVNGGICYPVNLSENDPYDNALLPFFYVHVARRTHSIVVELKDVPNQYIDFGDGQQRKGDAIMAYAWRQFLITPLDLVWPPHLPMAKATSLAMDAVRMASAHLGYKAPTRYVLTGVSKRGWASWLTALEDKRVVALVTAVNEMLDVTNTINYIHQSITYWPEAFSDYLDENIQDFMGSKNYDRLMEIEDPYQYIYKSQYTQRFLMPKYLIRTSGDDFFVPDCQNKVFEKVPGVNYIRVLPNQGHRLSGKQYLLAVYDFYWSFIYKKTLPKLTSEAEGGRLKTVTINAPAKKITLWSAYNKQDRDFRLSKGIAYNSEDLTKACKNKQHCVIKIPERRIDQGYLAQFVEVQFENITLTTNVYITPESLPGQLSAGSQSFH